MPNSQHLQALKDKFSESELWDKLRRIGRKAGREVVEKVLLLYYGLRHDEMPDKIRWSILGALAYFIIPTDIIPDFLLGAGFADDLIALGTAVKLAYDYMSEETKTKAALQADRLFGYSIEESAGEEESSSVAD